MEKELERKEGGAEKVVKLTPTEWEEIMAAVKRDADEYEGESSPEKIESLRTLAKKIKAQIE